jgi:hypothetical protein
MREKEWLGFNSLINVACANDIILLEILLFYRTMSGFQNLPQKPIKTFSFSIHLKAYFRNPLSYSFNLFH